MFEALADSIIIIIGFYIHLLNHSFFTSRLAVMAWDLEARERAWSDQIADVFNLSEESPQSSDFTDLTKEITNLQKQAVKVWWNIRSLEQYAKTGIIPRGLRVQIFPAWEVSGDFKEVWEKSLTQCSRIIIGMLVEHDQEILKQTKQ